MRGPERDRDRELRARAQGADRRHLTPVQLGQLLDQGQADAGALVAARDAARAMEALEQPLHLSGLDAGAGVLDRELDVIVDVAHADLDRALSRGLERVGDEVEDDPLPKIMVQVDRVGRWLAFHHQVQPAPVGGLAEGAGEIGGELGDVGGAKLGAHPPGLSAREVQQPVDQLEQPHGIAMHELQAIGLQAGRIPQRILEGAQHQRQRRTELVADVGEERRLGPVELLELSGAAALGVIGARR